MINSITIREENEEDEIHGIFREEEEQTIHSSSTKEEQIHHYYTEVEEIIYIIGILQVYLTDALVEVIICEEKESVNEVMSSICQETFSIGESAKDLPCNHCYKSDCIQS